MGRSKIEAWIFWIFIVLVHLPFYSLSLHSHPAIDDFLYAQRADDLGFMAAQGEWYLNWSGRYTTTALLSVLTRKTDLLVLCRVTALGTLVLLTCSIWWFLQVLGRGRYRSIETLGGATIVMAIYLSSMSSAQESFYSTTAAVCYPIPLAGAVCLITLLISTPPTLSIRRLVSRVLAGGLLSVLVAGSNETILAMTTVAIGFCTAYSLMRKSRLQPFWIFVIVVWIGAATTALLSPGSRIRMDVPCFAVNNRQLGWSLIQTSFYVVGHSTSWLLDPAVLSATTLLVMSVSKRSIDSYRKDRWIHGFEIIAAWVAIMGAGFFAAFWALGCTPPLRVLDQIRMIFLLGWLWLMSWSAKRYGSKAGMHALPPTLVRALKVVMLLALLYRGNVLPAYIDMAYDARIYATQWEQRLSTFQKASTAGEPQVSTPVITVKPRILWLPELGDSPNDGDIQSVARYYHLDKINLIENR